MEAGLVSRHFCLRTFRELDRQSYGEGLRTRKWMKYVETLLSPDSVFDQEKNCAQSDRQVLCEDQSLAKVEAGLCVLGDGRLL